MLGDDLGGRHALALGHRGAPSSVEVGPSTDESGPAVAGTTLRPSGASYTTCSDVTSQERYSHRPMVNNAMKALLYVGLAALALSPAQAGAQDVACGVYCEELPGSGGGNGGSGSGGSGSGGSGENESGGGSSSGSAGGSTSGTSSGGSGATGGGSGLVATETLEDFDRLGSDGRAAGDLADRSAPNTAELREAAAEAQGVPFSPAQLGGSSLPFVEASSSQDEGGIGFGLPALIVGSLVAAVAYALMRAGAEPELSKNHTTAECFRSGS